MPATLDATLAQFNRQSEETKATELASRLGLTYAQLDDYPFNLDVLSLVPLSTVQELGIAAYIRSASKVRVAIVHADSEALRTVIADLAAKWGKSVELTVVS